MDKKNPAGEPAAEGGGGSGQLFVMLTLAAALITPIVSGIMTVNMITARLTASGIVPKEEPKEGKEGEKKPAPPSFYPPLEFLVNLADTGETHYLRATISLAVTPPEGAVEEAPAPKAGGHGGGHGGGGAKADPPEIAALKVQEPMIRDLIIAVISSRTLEDLSTPQGKETLKEALRQRLQSQMGLAGINIYFTSFTLQ